MSGKKRTVPKAERKLCYCYGDFPESGYVAFMFIVSDEKVEGTFFLSSLYPDLERLKGDLPHIADYFVSRPKNKRLRLADQALAIPAVLDSRLPLKEEYWGNTATIDCRDSNLRFLTFLPVAQNPQLYNMLVLPREYHAGEGWLLTAAQPFYNTAELAVIETFMKQSNYPVEGGAKEAALYALGTPVLVDWRTGEECLQIGQDTSVDVGVRRGARSN